ncbi:hypothetical protein HDU87_004467 [Geranomyces variabilis]|uniref:Malonyl-CoA decarboxylase n=1 Tax=Geranomyces variabilis TaxID=109894 RepID=A0AAD5XRX6_9FUNG|nr:hypothetical protein HDU87_004467 [Geranomyces variabilis]
MPLLRTACCLSVAPLKLAVRPSRLALARAFQSLPPSAASAKHRSSSADLPSVIIAQFWNDLMKASRAKAALPVIPPGTNPARDESAIRRLLRATMLSRKEHGGGDMLPATLAARCCEFYEALGMDERQTFLTILARDFDVDQAQALAAAQAYISATSESADPNQGAPQNSASVIHRRQLALRAALRPLYEQFFDQVSHLPTGVQFLVSLRADVLTILGTNGNDAHLRALSESLRTKLQTWFGSTAQLELRRLQWDSTPAGVLEMVARYEAVHAVEGWQGLKQRLRGNARVAYAFFHRGLEGVPLTFVMVALVDAMPENVSDLLTDTDPHVDNPTAAVFYSISSSQKGLSGVDLGNFLIKRVVRELQALRPTLTTFATLSPIPRFRAWLAPALNEARAGRGPPLLLDGEGTIADFEQALEQGDLTSVKPTLLRLCARYLLVEKKRAAALDPVANFHLRNGACLLRLCWAGDPSEKGYAQSYGMMVHYSYRLPILHENNTRYLLDGTVAVIEPEHEDRDPAQRAVRWAVEEGGARVQMVSGCESSERARL